MTLQGRGLSAEVYDLRKERGGGGVYGTPRRRRCVCLLGLPLIIPSYIHSDGNDLGPELILQSNPPSTHCSVRASPQGYPELLVGFYLENRLRMTHSKPSPSPPPGSVYGLGVGWGISQDAKQQALRWASRRRGTGICYRSTGLDWGISDKLTSSLPLSPFRMYGTM